MGGPNRMQRRAVALARSRALLIPFLLTAVLAASEGAAHGLASPAWALGGGIARENAVGQAGGVLCETVVWPRAIFGRNYVLDRFTQCRPLIAQSRCPEHDASTSTSTLTSASTSRISTVSRRPAATPARPAAADSRTQTADSRAESSAAEPIDPARLAVAWSANRETLRNAQYARTVSALAKRFVRRAR